jgi:hypothetical protein
MKPEVFATIGCALIVLAAFAFTRYERAQCDAQHGVLVRATFGFACVTPAR